MLDGSPSGTLLKAVITEFARVEHWSLSLNSEEPVPALLLHPPHGAPRGIVLYCHAHGNRFEMGKDELLKGRPAIQSPPYGEVLPAMGYAVLAIDHWCFGERAANTERAIVKRLLWQGKTLWGYRVHDTLVALEWLRAQAEFANLPVTTLGLSMGSTMAIWAAALDPAIAACIDLCCLAEYNALLADNSFDLHGEYFFVPGLTSEFTAAEISALIAPRPHLSAAGRNDPLTPAAGLIAIDQALTTTYAMLAQPHHWQQLTDDCGHQETSLMRLQVLDFLNKYSRLMR
jgi:pimeloyl-ACP methyl ester carboxylesterase